MQVGLHHDLGIVVAELRPRDEERLARGRAPAARHQEVGGELPRLRHVEADDAAGVDEQRARRRMTARMAVVEAPADGRRRVGIVRFHQVDEGLAAALRAELRAQPREEVGVAHLGAAAVAEDRADERDDREAVVDGPGLGRGAALLEVRVDPVGVGAQVAQDLTALAAEGVDQLLLLRGDQRFRLGARHEGLSAGDERERVDARDVGHGRARRAPAELEQQAAVLGGDEAGAEPEVVRRLPVDVRHAEGVALDGQARAPGRLLGGRAGRGEALRLVEALDVGDGDVAPQRREAVVERNLVGRVDLGREPAVLPGRQHVVGEVVGGGGGGQRRQERDDHGERPAPISRDSCSWPVDHRRPHHHDTSIAVARRGRTLHVGSGPCRPCAGRRRASSRSGLLAAHGHTLASGVLEQVARPSSCSGRRDNWAVELTRMRENERECRPLVRDRKEMDALGARARAVCGVILLTFRRSVA